LHRPGGAQELDSHVGKVGVDHDGQAFRRSPRAFDVIDQQADGSALYAFLRSSILVASSVATTNQRKKMNGKCTAVSQDCPQFRVFFILRAVSSRRGQTPRGFEFL
jgi:hypothetical protein